ncbi:MAG: hydrogenase maturation protease, partial [Acidobacteria bacterium]
MLALGNTLLRDDGVGQAIAERIADDVARLGGRAELLDGGTQGMALLGRLEGRAAVLMLDAVARGAPPGSVHLLDGRELLDSPRPRGTT